MRISLIGMPGSGKSYWARRISDYFQIPFLDLDFEIEEMASMEISELFDKHGERYFRQIESETLKKILLQNNSDFVLATGGGTPIFHNNIDRLNSNTQSVYIEENMETLEKRVSVKNHKRPLFANKDLSIVLNDLFFERKEIYRKAQFKIVEPRKIEDFVNLLKS